MGIISEAMNMKHRAPVFAISGIKNSGKTTLIEKVVARLKALDYKVGVIKHDGHEFEADIPGTDSYRHKKAGAQNVIVYSNTKVMMVADDKTPQIEDLIALQSQMDVIILEGMKYSSFPKLEIVRRGISKAPICDPKHLMGIVTDIEDLESTVPVIKLDDIEGVVASILAFIKKAQ